ncbi:MAG: Crp/Fnr family transcriptional regulator [Microscillaceae bacterium]|nr:Crp/Fnr family transcriptional regulator [Microscillaceae bacterium]
MANEKQVWYLEEVDLYNILCPYKYAEHLKKHPLSCYNKNDFLFIPDQIVQDIFLIAEGKVKVGYYDEEGNELVKAFLGKGEILGEMSYLGNYKHKDFAEVMQNNTRICKMRAEKAKDLGRDYVPFALEMHKRIAKNVQRLERSLELLFHKDANRRLIELLHDLEEMYYPDTVKGWVDHGLTQQEIASLIGTSRKTVSLLLNEMERKGLIKLAPGKFLLLKKNLVNF